MHRWYIICVHGVQLHSPPFPSMAAPLKITFSHLEEGPSPLKATFWEDPSSSRVTFGEDQNSSKATYGGSPEEVENEKRGEDDMRPLASLMPPVNIEHGNFHDLVSARMWQNHMIWRAGVGAVAVSSTNARLLTNLRPNFQIIEGVASGSLNFISGMMVATLSSWPRAALPAGILVGNTLVVSCLISATAAASGAHINSIVTMATVFSGHCHPVRAVIYIFCQLVGGGLGGGVLRAALGKTLAYKIHNGGCWIDPDGEVNVWQAALIEFVCAFILLSVTFPPDRLFVSLNYNFTPGSWVTELDWIHARLSCLARNMGRYS